MKLFTSHLDATLLLAVVLGAASPATAGKVYVANHGTDSESCGSKADPCRSITKGIANATAGDTVSVGPGFYGDLDQDGSESEPGPGEEPRSVLQLDDGLGALCGVLVDKAVKVLSEAGAFSTVIGMLNVDVTGNVCLVAEGAVFGGKNKGFTVLNTRGAAVAAYAGGHGVTVEGNVLHCNGVGGAGYGGLSPTGGNRILGNRIFCPAKASNYPTRGIRLLGEPNDVIEGNTIIGAEAGIRLEAAANTQIVGNVFTGNRWGLNVRESPNLMVHKSVFQGNYGSGVLIDGDLGSPPITHPTTGAITSSTFVANGAGGADCGFDAGGTAVTATDSWWGAASGPGPDPADKACNAMPGATAPFRTKPVKVKPKPIR